MPGYFGSDVQARLQQLADESADWARATPGACLSGRMFGCDDVDKLGWPVALAFLARDGILGLRLMPAEVAPLMTAKLAEHRYRLDMWNVFTATKAAALERVEPLLAQGLSDGLSRVDLGDNPEGPTVRAAQAFMLDAGVVPFSGSMLLGKITPAVTVVLADTEGAIVATAHAYVPHNRHSPYHRFAFGGLVAVAESQRGKKLGRYVNAMMVDEAFRLLDIDGIYELVSDTNVQSRRMVESCGLSLDPAIKSGLAVPADRVGRFSK